MGHAGRRVARLVALEHAAHAIADREQEVEGRRGDPDHQLDAGPYARVRWRGHPRPVYGE
jgi:hypothetical protein